MRPLPPGPPGHLLWGHVAGFRSDVLGLVEEATRRYGGMVRFRVGPWPILLVNHPDLARVVLLDRHQVYTKETRSTARIAMACGESLLTSHGTRWQQERRRMQPVFQPTPVARLHEVMIAAGVALVNQWEAVAQGGQPIDIASEMMRVTFTIAARCLFGAELGEEAGRVERAMAVMLEHIYGGLQRLVNPPLWIPTPANLRFRQARADLDEIVYRIIRQRRANPGNRPDLLSVLLSATDAETGQGMGDKQLRNETITLLLAGHETTANALAWTWHLLGQHPAARHAMEEEVDRTLTSWPPSSDDFARLPVTTGVLLESLRLYPPIWIVERRAQSEDELGGYRVPRGTSVVVSPYLLHRHPGFWAAPKEFQPDRFLDGQPPVASRPAYLPFGLGPRHCIGNHFALGEARILLAMLSRRFRLEPVPGRAVVPAPGITLRLRDGLIMHVRRR